MYSLGLGILIGVFVLLTLYIICRPKTTIFETSLIVLSVIIILILSKTSDPVNSLERFQESDTGCIKSCTPGARGLVYGQPRDPTTNRVGKILYAHDVFDLRNMTATDSFNQLASDLNKLRAIPQDDVPRDKLYPIRYQDIIKLQYTLGRLKDYYLVFKGNGILNACTEDRFNLFQIINSNNPSSKDPINYDSQIVLRVYTEGTTQQYIMNNKKDIFLTTESEDNASVFKITNNMECSPNWMFDYENPQAKLLSAEQVNHMQKQSDSSCLAKVHSLLAERALLEDKLNQLKYGVAGVPFPEIEYNQA